MIKVGNEYLISSRFFIGIALAVIPLAFVLGWLIFVSHDIQTERQVRAQQVNAALQSICDGVNDNRSTLKGVLDGLIKSNEKTHLAGWEERVALYRQIERDHLQVKICPVVK